MRTPQMIGGIVWDGSAPGLQYFEADSDCQPAARAVFIAGITAGKQRIAPSLLKRERFKARACRK
jgi:hypothetical protein